MFNQLEPTPTMFNPIAEVLAAAKRTKDLRSSGIRYDTLFAVTSYALDGDVYKFVASPALLVRPLVTRLMREIEYLDHLEARRLQNLAIEGGSLVRLD